MKQFPDIEIPDFYKLSQKKHWNPKRYQPMVYNERIKHLSETLKPGTLEYDDFWAEMDYYCIHGFQPAGMPRITGRHFYYLNFTMIEAMPPSKDRNVKKKRKILMHPFYRDLDHWLFLEYEAAETYGYGLIVGKPRRVGLSEFGAVNANYELTFHSLAKIGICAGKEDKAAEFYQKLQSSLNNTHPAYKNGKMINNSEEMILDYKDTINKQSEKLGLQSICRIKTMYADSSAFEGGSYSMVIFEEAGLFESLQHSYKATEPCFMEGAIQFGVPLVYGTGGEIEKGAKGYKEMWDKHDVYNLKKIFVPAYMYYPSDNVPDEETGEIVSFFDYDKGVTDRERAKKYILEKRKIAAKSKDTYIKHVQSYPLLESEIFVKTKGGILDLVKLQFQLKEIYSGNHIEPVLRGRLEWVDEPRTIQLLNRAKNLKEKTKIRVENDSKVKFVIDENGPVWVDSQPINSEVENFLPYKPDIGACDSYDEEVDQEKIDKGEVSSGCVMAYRCFSGPTRMFNKPVGVLVERGDASFDDDVFYENAVKFAIYWDIEILFEYTKFHIMRYFKDVGAHKYIKARPDIEGTGNHRNLDGVKMDAKMKTIATKLLKAEVRDEIHKCFFENVIIDLMKYGEENTDIAMTYALCLMHRMDLFQEITEDIEIDTVSQNMSLDSLSSYYLDFDGNLKMNNNDFEIQTFIPERDLDKNQYEEYVNRINVKSQETLQRRTHYEVEAEKLGLNNNYLELIMKERERKQKNE